MCTKRDVLQTVREQDYVEYYIFPNDRNVSNEEELLKNLLEEINSFAKKVCKDYIWHCDGFELRYRTSKAPVLIVDEKTSKDLLPMHLFGVTHYADNIEDEWFVVYLLVQLTKQFPDVVVRVVDSDGEFLLIEAANHLPTWATPETCAKRVYLHQGKVHIVAMDEEEEEIEIKEAIGVIRVNPSLTVASPAIQDAIFKKITDFPAKITANQHHTTLFLPVSIAAILNHDSKLIAPAIRAFCNRDSVDMRICRAMKYFPPEDCVYARVTFTKFLYAMIRHSKFVPDTKSGWKLPSPTSKHFRAHELGVKVACGFEILASQASNQSWEVYKKKLQENHYFKDALEGSQEHNLLLETARKHFTDECGENRNSLSHHVLQLARKLDVDAVRCDLSSLPDDDSEEWLNITSEMLDGILNEQYGEQEKTLLSNTSNASDFSRKLEQFLMQTNSYEGVEYRKEEKKSEKHVDFDANNFTNAVESILNMVIPEDDTWHEETDSDMDEYGDEAQQSPLSDLNQSSMAEYIRSMDAELAKTTIGESFVKTDVADDDFDDIEDFKSVDIDVNALHNILESYKAQLGEAGPSSTMLGPMGIHVERTSD